MSVLGRRELEPRWVSEYMAKTYPHAEVRMRVPLGGIPKETQAAYGLMKGLRVYRPWRPEVDGIAILPGALELVEAKIFKYMDGLSKLPVYKSLIPSTPELAHVQHLKVEMILLIPAAITWVQQSGYEQGIKVVVWAPDYILQAWHERDKYWTKDAVTAREDRKRKLQEAGLS